jgi:uncharacterized protein
LINPSFHLYQLQKLDQKIDVLTSRLSVIAHLRNDNSIVQKFEVKHKLARTEIENSLTQLNLTEEIVRSKKLKIEQSESSLYSGTIKNPKELQDLQIEIQSLKKSLSALEESQLNQMIDFEEKEKLVAITESELLNSTREFENSLSGFVLEEHQITVELARLNQERSMIIEQVTPSNLKNYNDLRKSKKGIAVTLIEDGSCSICGTTLTPADCQNAKSPITMVTCQSCGRILYAG